MGRGGQTSAPARDGSAAASHKGAPFDATVLFVLWPRPGKHQPSADGAVICKARREDNGEEVILKGKFGPVLEGQVVAVQDWALRRDARGEHIRVWRVAHADPASRAGLHAYLTNMPGVGDALAEAIIDHFGEAHCLAEIDKNPRRLLEVATAGGRRISEEQLYELCEQWVILRAKRKNLIFLSELGLGDATARKVIDALGPDTKAAVNSDPYVLAAVKGIGFRIADRVARRMGVRPADPRRIQSGIEHLLREAKHDGHICLGREELRVRASALLGLRGGEELNRRIDEAIDELQKAGLVHVETREGAERIYSAHHYLIETRIYEQLEKRLTRKPEPVPEQLERPDDSPATDEQWMAVERGFSEPISVINGSAGTGKTTALRELLDAAQRLGQKVVLLAPTGKAAKRMTEATGRPASTIHRRLGPEGFEAPSGRDANISPEAQARLDADMVVVDEASMLNMEVAERLLSHLPEHTRLVLVGDPNQLPAIGAGSVLHDLIESGRVPTTKLTKIFRQAEDSLLVVNANRIKDGKEPFWSKEEAERELGHEVREDFEFIEVSDPERAEAIVQERAAKLARELGVPDEEVMVTAPTKRGAAGVGSLNAALRAYRNPHGRQIRDGELSLHEGDWVMNTENRYGSDSGQPDVMNGDQGRLVRFDPEARTAWVKFEGIDTEVAFSGEQLDALIPAYAATTHKLQGSEAAGLIAPYVRRSQLLSRNMIYTALTRGKRKAVLVGDKEIIREALKVDGSARKTTLDLRVGAIRRRLEVAWEVIDEAERRRRAARAKRREQITNLQNPWV